jgi:hypothetical protein
MLFKEFGSNELPTIILLHGGGLSCWSLSNVVGEKERSIMKKSAQVLNKQIANSKLYIAQNMGHGELSLANSTKFAQVIGGFITE